MNISLRNMTSLYLYSENKMLFLYRIGSRVVDESYVGTAGGHFEEFELNDAQACVLRELNEETGLSVGDIDQLRLRYVTLRLKDGEIRQNYYFFARLKNESKEITSSEGILQWMDMDFGQLMSVHMPYTAKYVIEHYLKEGRYTDKIYSGVAVKDGVVFTEMNEF